MTPEPSRAAPAAIVRHPYDPRRLDALVVYSEAHRPSPYVTPPVRRILAELSPPEGIVELRVGGRSTFVAAVVDRCENRDDAAVLEVLGLDAGAPVAACLAVATPIALAVAAAAGRRALNLSLPAALPAPPPWVPAVGHLVLERGAEPWPEPPPPGDATWRDLSRDRVETHYRTLRDAFVDDPGMMLPDPATFAAAALAADPPVRVLVRGREELGFARVTLPEPQLGYVATVGRAPARRGEGLGPVVMAEALRVAAARGARRFRLGVTANNTAAIALYRATGFRVVDAWAGYTLPVPR